MQERIGQPQAQPTPAPWPDGVIARYLTVAGATADVIDAMAPWRGGTGHNLRAACTGELCERTSHGPEFWFDAEENPRDDDDYRSAVRRLQADAQEHAEKCRAVSRPAVTG
jgi:hypothetical protein